MITYCLQRYDFFLIPPKNALQKCVSNFYNRNHCNHLWDILFLGFEYFHYICTCYSKSYDYDRIYT